MQAGCSILGPWPHGHTPGSLWTLPEPIVLSLMVLVLWQSNPCMSRPPAMAPFSAEGTTGRLIQTFGFPKAQTSKPHVSRNAQDSNDGGPTSPQQHVPFLAFTR